MSPPTDPAELDLTDRELVAVLKDDALDPANVVSAGTVAWAELTLP